MICNNYIKCHSDVFTITLAEGYDKLCNKAIIIMNRVRVMAVLGR